jgi:hypothetical protein
LWNPFEKNSPRPGSRHHISRYVWPCAPRSSAGRGR